MDLKQAVIAEARRLGFTLAGVTTAEPPPHFSTFERWLAQGRHGEMAYLAGEAARLRRSDPRLILPECRSILVLGAPYPASPPALPAPGHGRVASYAWGDDYHEVLAGRLRLLASFIQAHSAEPVVSRWYTDTGPVLERDLAQRAGLGWIGKNTCLIHPQTGSYFFLAELLLSIEMETDPPFTADHCGTCTRCLDACPTGCILPDRTLDARRCISYLTIELKGGIPPELRSFTGDWLFGCDICQQVCPWNRRFAPAGGDPAFAARPGLPSPAMETELALTPQEFNRKFKNSPLRRAKRRGYLRNVATALGNSRRRQANPALRRAALEEPEALIREHAAWALEQMNAGQP
jgi:epoxyqueuosine reductase